MELLFRAVLKTSPAASPMIYAPSFKGLKSAEQHERASAQTSNLSRYVDDEKRREV